LAGRTIDGVTAVRVEMLEPSARQDGLAASDELYILLNCGVFRHSDDSVKINRLFVGLISRLLDVTCITSSKGSRHLADTGDFTPSV
jgi:hypothetical protein